MYKHITRDGKEIPLNELETSHLRNIIAFQKKKAIKGFFYCEYIDAPGCYAIFEHLITGDEALAYMHHDLYVQELMKR